MSAVGQRLSRYELLAKIATGGMGEIFLARMEGQAGFAKRVVLKRLLPELVPTGRFVSMFLDEARLAARLSHPNVCEVYDLGVEDHQYFIVMQYLDGVPFSKVMVPEPGVDPISHARLVATLAAQACEGLHHAHELRGDDGAPLNVVHRDVSPSNLFVTTDGILKVLDFGIAKAATATDVTERGMLKGKLAYMSPEQLLEEKIDRRSDVFCLGIVLWEALAGRRLFKRDSPAVVTRAVLEDEITDLRDVRPEIPKPLAATVMKALRRDPSQRFATAREMGEAITAALSSVGGVMPSSEIAAIITRRFASDLRERRDELARTDSGTAATTPRTKLERPSREPPRSIAPWITAGAVAALAIAFAIFVAVEGRTASPSLASPSPASPIPASPSLASPSLASPSPASPSLASPSPASPSPASPSPAKRRERSEPAKADGFLSVDSTPYAVIYLDGKRLGDTPLLRRPVPAGRHTLRAVLADGRSRTIPITIEPDTLAPPIQLSW